MRKFLVIFIVVFAVSGTRAQLEIGLFGGASYYIGDLNPNVPFLNTDLAYGFLGRYALSSRWAIKGNVYQGVIHGDDETSNFIPDRELAFKVENGPQPKGDRRLGPSCCAGTRTSAGKRGGFSGPASVRSGSFYWTPHYSGRGCFVSRRAIDPEPGVQGYLPWLAGSRYCGDYVCSVAMGAGGTGTSRATDSR